MKNTHIGKNFYIISFLIVLILLGSYMYLNQTDSDEHVDLSVNKAKVEKIISQKDEQTSDNPKISEDQNNLPETDEIEESQPKEIRIVAEEILYPDEYDFGDSMSEITLAVGKPIKFDITALTKSEKGDTIEFDFGGMSFHAKVEESEKKFYEHKQEGDFYIYNFDANIGFFNKNNIRGTYSMDINNNVSGTIHIESNRGEYNIHLYNGLAYYVNEYDRQDEFYKRGYKLD